MRLGGRLAAAIEVLRDMEQRRRPVAEALKDWGLSHRFAGSGDRGAIGNIVYDTLRRRLSAAWLMDDDSVRGQAFGALILEWGLSPDAINTELTGDRFAPEPLSADELAGVQRRLREQMPDEVRADCPDWVVPHLQAAFGEAWAQEAAGLADRPPLDLRANTLMSDRETVLRELGETGAEPMRIASQGVRIAPIAGGGRHPNVQAEPAFQKGWFEIQDEGSQVAAELAGAKPGMQVLDYCAGGGGKTLALAAIMKNEGRIVAHDSEKQRLAPIFDRLRRSEVRNVEVMARAPELEPLVGSMDIVLIDAPCTGSGTWRRRPDAKWRLSQKQVDQRCREQADILDKASRFVKPGGRLVYITCSVFDAENRDQLEAFAARNEAFKIVDHVALWRESFPDAADLARVDARGGIRLSPALSGTDGFYFSALERAG
ncbi:MULTISPECIES: RsmB/NOP family class I SAM-dependent RNA methyltransferase [Mesorhizobium]|uniref:RsmB/NOP family class I SAM-dependent RNA methyltransferase n=1 Tax=Mesorhizobium denitrificans TaxID=2294114 RepID=A0A371XCT8_9HYPH|nr:MULTISPECIES: RsmB/NOP family class I SAM-dependent RNA methyltransferase [Mesorhizobium]RFC67038.1 RsmB/NOP family class I SAM-dependent RNA methyltransferase [Mesorhizobium denitrificans]